MQLQALISDAKEDARQALHFEEADLKSHVLRLGYLHGCRTRDQARNINNDYK